jgi:3-dehydroquinate synthase
MRFTFGEYKTDIFTDSEIPNLEKIASDIKLTPEKFFPLIICDENTGYIADIIRAGKKIECCVLKSGEEHKTWQSVECILKHAYKAGLSRDGLFLAVGGGVTGDLAGFAASVYMRGCRFALVSTTLLGMVDASVGGKTGFDMFEIKNLIGAFYPASAVYLPFNALQSLPAKEWKSGMGEIIKTAVLESDNFIDELIQFSSGCNFEKGQYGDSAALQKIIEKSVMYKAKIVSEDPKESGIRMLLNLGHSFAHALESNAGLGKITHGEAVAWGIIRSCETGLELGITPEWRARKISKLISRLGYECKTPHPLAPDSEKFLNAMKSDKKRKSGKLTLIIPDQTSARAVTLDPENETDVLLNVIKGKISI